MKIGFLEYACGGDILAASPIAKRLRELYPDADITWICFDSFRDYIKNNQYVSSYIAWPLVPGYGRQQQEVQRWNEIKYYAYENFDKVVIPQYWPDHIADWGRDPKETLTDLMVEYAGIGPVEDRRIVYDCDPTDEIKANRFVADNELWDGNGKFICVAPNANSVGKLLKASDYNYLKKYLGNTKVVFFGTKNDEPLEFGINGLGTSIGVMYALFKRSRGFIGLASAPAIMYTNLELPMVVLENPQTFDLHKIRLTTRGMRTKDITELIIDPTDIEGLFEKIAKGVNLV
jgi:ADP-heptose:LPS heptosyltransferase